MVSIMVQGYPNKYRRSISHFENVSYSNIYKEGTIGVLYQWGGPNDETTFKNFLFTNISNTNFIIETTGLKSIQLVNFTLSDCQDHTNEIFHIYDVGDVQFKQLELSNFQKLGQDLLQAGEVRTLPTGSILFDSLKVSNVIIKNAPFILFGAESQMVNFTN